MGFGWVYIGRFGFLNANLILTGIPLHSHITEIPLLFGSFPRNTAYGKTSVGGNRYISVRYRL